MENTIKNPARVKGGLLTVAHGGKIVRGRWIDENSPIAQTLKKCSECPIRKNCGKFEEKSRCFYQIENLKAEYKMQGALTSGDPRDLIRNIQTTIGRMESIIKYDEMIGKQPRIQDVKELAFLKLQVYEMLYGRSKQPLTQVNVNAPSFDVKSLMQDLRKENSEEVVEVEVKKENDNT